MRMTMRLAALSRPLAPPLLGVIVGLAVAGLVWIHDKTRTSDVAYHGRYVPIDGITISRAYQSTLRLTYDNVHHASSVTLLIGAAIGLLAGVVLALVLGGRGALSGSWPSGSIRR